MNSARTAIVGMLLLSIVLALVAPFATLTYVQTPVTEVLGLQLLAGAHLPAGGFLSGVDKLFVAPQPLAILAFLLTVAALVLIARNVDARAITSTFLCSAGAVLCLVCFAGTLPISPLPSIPGLLQLSAASGLWATMVLLIIESGFCLLVLSRSRNIERAEDQRAGR